MGTIVANHLPPSLADELATVENNRDHAESAHAEWCQHDMPRRLAQLTADAPRFAQELPQAARLPRSRMTIEEILTLGIEIASEAYTNTVRELVILDAQGGIDLRDGKAVARAAGWSENEMIDRLAVDLGKAKQF